ncbi:hypothetical protein FWH09_03415, partial [Candidatus Saccharibacteria bacterium]|nr:hypothetical protein [Candidatus Saccharibacteria bacterium]
GSDKVYKKGEFGFESGTSAGVAVSKNVLEADARKSLKKIMRQELINRFDDIVLFDPLTEETRDKIIKKLLADLSSSLRKQKIAVNFSPKVALWLSAEAQDMSGGARHLRRLVYEKINDFIIDKLASGELQEAKTVTVGEEKLILK